MFADSHGKRRSPKEKNRLKRADRGGLRTTEQGLRTWALMPSGLIAEAGSLPDRTFSIFSGEKDIESNRQRVCRGKIGTELDGFDTCDLEATTESPRLRFEVQLTEVRIAPEVMVGTGAMTTVAPA